MDKYLIMATILRDYQHAKKLFVADTMQFAPKQKFLYYVAINTDQTPNIINLGNSESSLSLQEQYEAGMLVKRIDLPKFNLNTKTVNNYNRKEIIHTKIEYEPISMTFHDDAADLILRLWNDYYTHYYRDSDYQEQNYKTNDKYGTINFPQWGMNPRSSNPYLRSIQIYSLHNKRFTEYTLINPHISNMRHGDHDSYASTDVMEVVMTVGYETVKYATGFVNPVDVNGFATLHYDNTESPLGGSFINTQGELGILGAITGSKSDLSRPAGTTSGGDLLSTIGNAARAIKAVKNANLGALAKATAIQVGASAINNVLSGKSPFPSSASNLISGDLSSLKGSVSGLIDKAKNIGANGIDVSSLSNKLNIPTNIAGIQNFTGGLGGQFSGGLGGLAGLGGSAEGSLYANTSDTELTYTGDDPIIIERINRERARRGMQPLGEYSE